MVIQSLVLSHIKYCLSISGMPTVHISRIIKLQNFAARVAVGGLRKYDQVSPTFKELSKWLRIKQLYTFLKGVAMFKVISSVYPSWIFYFSIAHDKTVWKKNTVVPPSRTGAGASAYSVTGAKMWNSLPSNITTISSLPRLKIKLSKFILPDLNTF